MNAEELIERLRKSFHAPSTKDEKFKVVLVCIVISTTFWFFNALNQENYTTQISYPIQWSFDGDRYLVVGELPERIPVEVNGGGWDLMTRSFGFNMSPIDIVLASPQESKYILTSQLRGDLSRNLDPVTINYVIRDSLKYDIQERVTRRLALQFDPSNITFDSDYKLNSDYRLRPDSIEVEGPKSIIESLPEYIDLSADINEVDGDFDDNIDLPALAEYVEPSVNQVNLSFEVIRFISISEQHDVELLNLPDTSWRPVNGQILVDYVIGETEFDATDSTRIRLVADFERMDSNDSTITVEVITGRSMIERIQLSSETIKMIKP